MPWEPAHAVAGGGHRFAGAHPETAAPCNSHGWGTMRKGLTRKRPTHVYTSTGADFCPSSTPETNTSRSHGHRQGGWRRRRGSDVAPPGRGGEGRTCFRRRCNSFSSALGPPSGSGKNSRQMGRSGAVERGPRVPASRRPGVGVTCRTALRSPRQNPPVTGTGLGNSAGETGEIV